MSVVGIVIFGLTYVLISARRLQLLGLDRPAAAVLGAVACVGVGLLSPEEALGAIDGATLLLLFGVMGMGAFLAVDGFFDQIEGRLLLVARTPSRLLGLTVWGAGILSALITNDAVCVLGAPLVVRMIKNRGLPPLPFLLALATGANTGSVATLVGNPQNMLCGLLGDLSYRDHLLLMAPVAALGLAINHLLLWWPNRRELSSIRLRLPSKAAPISPRAKVTLAVIGATSVGYVLGADLAWTSAGGFIVLMLLHRRDTRELWPRIDWSLLVFFGGLFVVVGGLMKSGLPDAVFERFPLSAHGDGFAGWTRLAGIFLVGSNVVSNVPFILVVRDQMSSISDPTLAWELLAMASTFAGNLTLLGSVANVIVAESAREIGGFGFWQHLRVGLPLALLTTALGTVWVVWSGIGT
jgi:Na+/H+ antiporter NhaD/arsenite permease-like protein